MLYITKTNLDQKTARAKHVKSLIKYSKYLNKDITFICKDNKSKNKIFFYLKVIYFLFKRPQSKIYTRDFDIALIIHILRRKGVFEIHQFGFIKRDLDLKFIYIRRFILFQILKSSRIQIVVLTKYSSQFLKRLFKQKLNKKIHVITDASDDLKMDNHIKTSCKKEKINLGYCGSFLPGKGGFESIKIAKDAPQFNFLLAGPITKNQKLEISNYSNCYYYGNLDEKSLENFYEECDILIAPVGKRIFLDFEKKNEITFFTSPLKIYEYIVKNKPIISTNCPSTREFKDIKGIWLINKNDSLKTRAWINTIITISKDSLFRNDELIYKLRAKDIYNWGDRLNDMEKVL